MYTCLVAKSVGVAYHSAWLTVYEGIYSSFTTLFLFFFPLLQFVTNSHTVRFSRATLVSPLQPVMPI